MAESRIASIDYGSKRIGIAVSDPLRSFAQPVGAFDAAGAVDALKAIRDRDGLDTIVIGWPISEDGTENAATRRVDAFVRRLRNALGKIVVVRWDERYTSEEARDRLREAPGRKSGRADRQTGRLDTAVAGLLLDEYLGSLAFRGNV